MVRPKVLETTALGAAYLAGLAVGFWHDAGDIKANWQVDRVFEPTLCRATVRRDDGGLGAGGGAEQGLGTLTPAIDQLSLKRPLHRA